MNASIRNGTLLHRQLCRRTKQNNSGQALVEFTLIFVLFLVIAWIPADFGLAFFTGQLAQNASREGARIAAADPSLSTGKVTCTMPCSGAGNILEETALRLSPALMPGAEVTVELEGGTGCDRTVTVSVSGNYNFFFYRILNLLGGSVDSTVPIQRRTEMRWEHQNVCG